MKVSTKSYKGARDFYPEDKRLQKWMFDKWRIVVERFGYEEYDAPILEPTDLYLMKGSEEIVKEQTYTFKDRGDRSVTIRTEMTPTVSRMIAGRRQELSYPVRWYSIPNLWRYERMQRGRLREFWQLNVDAFGFSSVQAEIEMLQIADALFQEFKAKRSSYLIKVNSRVLVNELFEKKCKLNTLQTESMIRLTDKINKMSSAEFSEKVTEITKDNKLTKKIIEILSFKNLDDLPEELISTDSAQNLKSCIDELAKLGIRNVEFDLTLMRGFDYYTDIVFEAFDTNPENNRALLGGGRYDGLVAQFGVESVPTVGFAVGDVGFMNFLETHKLIPVLNPKTDLSILVRDSGSISEARRIAKELREMELDVAVDFSERKIDKQFKSAVKTNIRYAVFVGPEEIKSELYVLKDLNSGVEEKHGLNRIASIVKDTRKGRQ
jgi:histidyl-tRNA synthetase